MDLYFSPLACSMATRITLYEVGAAARFVEVDTRAGRAEDGTPFATLNPLGQVPVLRTDSGEILSENAAILQYVADRFPEAGLAPPAGSFARSRLQQWLSFVGTELHKSLAILLRRENPDGAKAYARDKLAPRLAMLDAHFRDREHLMDRFTVADAYLVTVLNWSQATGTSLAEYPALEAWYRRTLQRPSVARAIAEERALYLRKKERAAATAGDQTAAR
jgi:glutathione S-transferase